jgi:hypothetical protein
VTVYGSAALTHRIAAAQQQVDRHVVTGRDGRCRGCGEFEPCTARQHAAAVFAGCGGLPRRRPGLASSAMRPSTSRPEGLLGGRP